MTRASPTHRHGSCPRRINMRKTTERPHSLSIKENGACSSGPSSGISSRWRVLRDLRLHHGASSGAGRSSQMRRSSADARLEKTVVRALVLIGSAQRKRERYASYLRRSRRKLVWRVSLPVRNLPAIDERELIY